MFKSKTVFIVGAGASCEAGLPAGDNLKQRIAELLDIRFSAGSQISGDYAITDALRRAVRTPDGRGGNINPYLHKAWSIRDVVPAAAISIDNYLDAHQGDGETELCGKLGIVQSILDAERESKLGPRDRERGDYTFKLADLAGSWYVGFLQMATENVPAARAEKAFENVTIITFNYDRCIERFLVQAFAAYYRMSKEDAEQIVARVPLFHPYGQVGALQWQNAGTSVAFGSEDADILPIARGIKTFTQGMDDDEALANMHSALLEAETVVFLGFAFHPSNMKLLTPHSKTSVKKVFATTLGLSKADVKVIERDVWQTLGREGLVPGTRASMTEMSELKCGDFFRQYFRSLSSR